MTDRDAWHAITLAFRGRAAPIWNMITLIRVIMRYAASDALPASVTARVIRAA